jgi:soluble lytic murein transglycosylase-like protein
MNTLTALFMTMSLQYGLPPKLLSSICYIESTHNVHAVHHDDGGADSLGVCQIKLATAKGLGFKGTAKQLMDPKLNIKYAAKYLSHQIKRYNGSIEKAVIAYNKGNAKGLTTSKYQRKIFKQWRRK